MEIAKFTIATTFFTLYNMEATDKLFLEFPYFFRMLVFHMALSIFIVVLTHCDVIVCFTFKC